MNTDFSKLQADSLNKLILYTKKKKKYLLLDSIGADSTLRALAHIINEKKYMEATIPDRPNLYKGINAQFILTQLDWPYVKKMCQLYETDLLVAMEVYYTDITTQYATEQLDQAKLYSASMDVAYQTHWRIYDPEKESILTQYMVKDTVSWTYSTPIKKQLQREIPDVRDIICYASYNIAEEYSKQICPEWQVQERIIFNKGSDTIQKSAQLILENKFIEAQEVLLKEVKTISKSDRSKAAYNLALAYELEGQLDSAMIWVQKSHQAQFRNQSIQYLELLKKRKKLIEQFDAASQQ
ncbi:hypothetical protein EMN47_10065 [Prolixibacteraceae bacterium JC049]|nr:hypothetical protein [Prolixibacteraceae bacterium JC049]